MQLTPRKREILRRVIEEYVATGQPVGSRVLVERSDLAVSPSTVRSELAELETLGPPHAPAHLRRAHTDGERVPRLCRRARRHARGRPDGLGVDLRPMRDEIERPCARRPRCFRTRRACSRSSRRRRSRPPRSGTSRSYAAADDVMVVVITSTGGVTKRCSGWTIRSIPASSHGRRVPGRAVRRRAPRFPDGSAAPRRAGAGAAEPCGNRGARRGAAGQVPASHATRPGSTG